MALTLGSSVVLGIAGSLANEEPAGNKKAAKSWRLIGSLAANHQIVRDPPAASELRCVQRPKR
ncbi:hypothetical protein BRADO3874 [Bradyrhizobium sp. ORS 278]|nr:hypothetical protein BRADO3874 [Bradyrhizobium sp. ORS 278]